MKKFDIEVPKSLTEIVATRVRDAIIDGEFKLGERISEEILAQSFGVSRTPARDALTLLQTTGLVEIRPKRGSFVFQPSEQDIRAICEFRVVLEVHAAKLCRSYEKAAIVEALEAILIEMRDADAADDGVRYSRSDSAFHGALFEHCGNSYVRDSYGLMAGKIAAMRTTLSKQFGDARAVSMNEHQRVIQFIRDGDFDGLEKLLKAHVFRTVEAFMLASKASTSAKPSRLSAVRAAPQP